MDERESTVTTAGTGGVGVGVEDLVVVLWYVKVHIDHIEGLESDQVAASWFASDLH
jgi:hypothetical protein